MIATREQLKLEGISTELELRPIEDTEDIEMACEVFNNAYLTPNEDGVGYSGLPPAYTEAFRLGLTRSKAFGSIHLLGISNGKPVAIASAFFSGRSAGIYNVAGPDPLPLSHIVKLLGKPSIPIPYTFGRAVLKRLWALRLTTFPAPELDHIRYVCMVDDRRSREDLGYEPEVAIEETVRSVELESW